MTQSEQVIYKERKLDVVAPVAEWMREGWLGGKQRASKRGRLFFHKLTAAVCALVHVNTSERRMHSVCQAEAMKQYPSICDKKRFLKSLW